MVQPKYNPQEALERVKLMMNYDLSKTSTENKKVIEEQTQKSSDPFACVKNYYTPKNIKFKEGPGPKASEKYIQIYLTEKIIWTFNIEIDTPTGDFKWWYERDGGVLDPNKGWGNWECDGNNNFIIKKQDGTIYKSTQATTTQTTQPAQTQPAQTQPKVDKKQDTPDSSKPQKLRPNDDPLRATLKDSRIPKRTCIAFIDTYHKLWTQCKEPKDAGPECKNEAQIIERRGYVQRCMNQHFPSPKKIGQGQWGITGLVTKDTDRKLLELSACQTPAPSQSGPDSIFRLTRKC